MPYSVDPDRFPEWSLGQAGRRPRILVARSSGREAFFREIARREGAAELLRAPGVTIFDWR